MTLLLQAALGAIGPQPLPPTGCAAFLWTRDATPQLVAMAAPAALTVQLDGRVLTLPRVAAEGTEVRGLPATSRYGAGGVSATLALSVVERPDLADGALVPDATLTVAAAGGDTVVAPLGGMIGCAPAANGASNGAARGQ